jgi:PAS domain S-box-containing protein
MYRNFRQPVRDYGTALFIVAAAVGLRALLDPWLGDFLSLTTVYVAIALVVLVGGSRPAILAAVIGYVCAAYLFIPPRYEFGAHTPRHIVGFVVYVGSCAIIIISGEALRGARRRAEAAARAAEEERERSRAALARQASILEAALDGIIVLDHVGKVVEFNPAAEALFGRRRADVIGHEMAGLIVPPALRERYRHGLARYLATGQSSVLNRRLEMPALRADGSEILVELAITVLRRDGPPVFTAYLRDVTERARAERRRAARLAVTQALAEEVTVNEAARRVLAGVGEGLEWDVGALWCLDRNLNRLRCVETWRRPGVSVPRFESETRERLFERGVGLPGRVWASGRPLWMPDVTTDDNFPRAPIADGEGLHAAFGAPVTAGSEFLGVVEFFSREIREPDADLLELMATVGGQVGLFVERRRAEEELLRREQQLQIVANTMSAPVTRCSRDFRYLWVSRSCAEWFGCRADELIGRPIMDVIGIEAFEQLRPRFERVLAGEQVRYEECVNYRGLGPRWISAIYTPTFDAAGAVDGWVAVVLDIEERLRIEESLREADRRKNEFLATLAHELRNPLAPMRNAVQIMGQTDDTTLAERARGILERQLGQMVRLIDDLLDVSRITRGKLELRREAVTLESVIGSALEISRPLIDAAGHELTVVLPPGPVMFDADPTRLAQVFANLLNNAAKFTDRGGRIMLAAAVEGTDAVVSVNDTGIGIPADRLPHIFDMFSQVAPALERSQGGLGIGLSLVKGLVEMHGGGVEVRSEGPDRGSEFVVRLPTTTRPAAPEPGRLNGHATAGCGAWRVLVVDDLHDSADSLAVFLRLAGHDVRTAYDGPAAVEVASTFRPEVILLDIGLPGMNGYEVAQHLREQPWGQTTILVAVTGWGQEEDKRRAREAGIEHHLTKPVIPGVLQRLLAELAPAH